MKWKRNTALLLAATICLGAFTACSGNPSASSGTVSSESTSETKSSTSSGATLVDAAKKNTNFNPTGKKIVKEKQNFTIWVLQTSSEKKTGDRACSKKAEEDTNVHIDWVEIASGSLKEKVNISLASGDMPDAYTHEIDGLSSYVERFQPLNDLIEAYAPSVKEMFVEMPELKASLADYNGIIRGLPTGDAYIGNTMNHMLWINQQWLKNVGMSLPTTTDEFEAVLKAFKEKDPNKNGKQDEIPFTFRNVWEWSTGCGDMFGPFGTVENDNHVFIDPKDKTLKFAPQEKGYYEALQWLHKLFSEGLIQNTVFTISSDMYGTQLTNKDNIGAFINYSDSALGNTELSQTWFTPMDSDDPSHVYRHVPALKGPDGTRMVFQGNLKTSPAFLITTKCKTPEVLVRWYDYINTGLENYALWRWGKENERWHYATVDQKHLDEYKKLHPNLPENLIPIKVGDKVPAQYDTTGWDWKSKFGYKDGGSYENAESLAGQALVFERAGIISNACINESKEPELKLKATMEDLPYAVKGIPAGMSTKENEEERAKIKADLDTYLLRFISDSIMNGIDDSKWQTHLGKLKDMKADRYLTLCQEATEKINSITKSNSSSK